MIFVKVLNRVGVWYDTYVEYLINRDTKNQLSSSSSVWVVRLLANPKENIILLQIFARNVRYIIFASFKNDSSSELTHHTAILLII